MFDSLCDMIGKGILGAVIVFTVPIWLAMKHPKASGGIARGILGWLFRK